MPTDKPIGKIEGKWGSRSGWSGKIQPDRMLFNRKVIHGLLKTTVNCFTSKGIYGTIVSEVNSTKESPLVALRSKVGLTQEELALQLGVTDHTVRNWEKGRSEAKLTLRQVKKLCELLQCSVQDLPDTFSPIENA
jgi:DNA-binding XRE family transcriptional regulator